MTKARTALRDWLLGWFDPGRAATATAANTSTTAPRKRAPHAGRQTPRQPVDRATPASRPRDLAADRAAARARAQGRAEGIAAERARWTAVFALPGATSRRLLPVAVSLAADPTVTLDGAARVLALLPDPTEPVRWRRPAGG